MITRLKLVNFIGIKSGTGLDEIEINFPKNGNIITALNGGNGSGKSTIMSMLTPFKDSFDDRKNLILKGKEGIKEIEYDFNGHKYLIKHVYGKQSLSYFSEDGVELNSNGGVRSCEDLIKQKFKIDKDYLKIGKLGSNTETFINYATSQRKVYISTLIESSKKYLDAYKIVKDKAKINNDKIKQIANDLKKFDDIDTLERKILENTESFKEKEALIKAHTAKLGTLAAEITALTTTMLNIDYTTDKTTLVEKEAELKQLKSASALFKLTYGELSLDQCESDLKEIASNLMTYLDNKTKADSDLATKKAELVNVDNNITKVQAQLTGKSVIDLSALLDEINALKSNIQANEAIVNASSLGKLVTNDIIQATTHLDRFKEFATVLDTNYTILQERTLDASKTNAEYIFSATFNETYNNCAHACACSISENKILLDTKNDELSKLRVNLDKLEILNKRPTSCTNDECPFIKDALQYKDLPDKLKELDDIIEGIGNTITNNEDTSEKLTALKVAQVAIATAYNRLPVRGNLAFAYMFRKHGSLIKILSKPLNDLNAITADASSELETVINAANVVATDKAELAIKESQYSTSVESEKSRLYFENELLEYNKEKVNITNDITSLTTVATAAETIYNNENTKKTDYENYKLSLLNCDSLQKEIDALNSRIKTYEDASKQKTAKETEQTTLTEDITRLEGEKTTINEAITGLKATEISVNAMQESLAALKLEYTDVDNVKQALSPKSGIPLIFIKAYLDGTETIANELLNVAYGGKFSIKFIPTSDDFFIQVINENNIIEDIKQASQGEVSMTAISLSLALIERSMGGYNIMYLDEIDGPLDQNNRPLFIDILNKQIEKLGIEQIFVISHNNAFNDCPMNLILLPENSINKDDTVFMNNKEIICEVTK